VRGMNGRRLPARDRGMQDVPRHDHRMHRVHA
jgi:hypothetical protein